MSLKPEICHPVSQWGMPKTLLMLKARAADFRRTPEALLTLSQLWSPPNFSPIQTRARKLHLVFTTTKFILLATVKKKHTRVCYQLSWAFINLSLCLLNIHTMGVGNKRTITKTRRKTRYRTTAVDFAPGSPANSTLEM